jgi:hypothetical protein
MKKRFTEEQIIGFLRAADAGMPEKKRCRVQSLQLPRLVFMSYRKWRSTLTRSGECSH